MWKMKSKVPLVPWLCPDLRHCQSSESPKPVYFLQTDGTDGNSFEEAGDYFAWTVSSASDAQMSSSSLRANTQRLANAGGGHTTVRAGAKEPDRVVGLMRATRLSSW